MLRLNTLLLLLFIASLALFTVANEAVDSSVESSVDSALDAQNAALKASLEGDVPVVIPEGAPSADLSEAEQASIAESGEQHEFQAEITRLMDIIINSLYSKRDIFLRELISNAADALDKVRYLALTNQTSLAGATNLDIKIAFDREKRTLSITDTGVGMNKEDLIKNLGIVAKSGTSDFLEAAAKGSSNDALSLIGQFGVGFYSVYLVADRVTVISKKADSPDQWIWESNAERSFTVSKDPRGNTLGRGTQLILHMKEDATEFINEHEIKKLVERYSEFINYPIYLYTSKMVDPEPEVKPASEDLEVTEEDVETATKDPAAKVEKWSWERLNDVKAIWTRAPSDISEDEYAAFYKTLTKDTKEPLTHIHFKAEGEITFRAILFIPSVVPSGMYDKFYEKSTALKLYVRRVLISDEFDDFLPRYLNFIRGVVDSEDLPLNVSRETLAQSKVLRVMAKKLTRKVLEMIRKMSDANKAARTKAVEEGKVEELEEDDYDKFWTNYGKSLKLGVIDDRTNKAKLSKFLRFFTSKSNGKAISLDEYVDRMKPTQRQIYYITGESVEAVKSSPFVEKLEQKDIEVVYMVDPVDEYLLQSMTEYEGTSLVSITKEGLTIDDQEEKRQKAYAEEFQPLTTWLSSQLGARVSKVAVSSRVATSPMVIVTGQFGWSSNMERIMAAQTFSNAKENTHMRARKTLEINPRHPIIRELQTRIQANEEDEQAKNVVELLYDAALLQSGFMHESPSDFAKRIHRLTAQNLQLDPEAPLAAEIEVPADEVVAEEEELDHEEL